MKKNVIWLILIFSLLLASCGTSNSDATPTLGAEAIYTAAAQTVAAQLTEAATMFVSTPTNTAEPTIAPTATAMPTIAPLVTSTTSALVLPTTAPATSGNVCDKATFVMDVSIPDGSLMDLGETFTKTWQLKNEGTCTWSTDYALVFYEGEQMAEEKSYYLENSVAPNASVDVSIEMTAPTENGKYKSVWVLQNASGIQISPTFYVEIKVSDGEADYSDAAVAISDYSVDVGDEITIYVTDFPAKESVDVCLRLKSESDCAKLKDGETDSSGKLSRTLTIPTSADSGEYWVVEVRTTEMSDEVSATSPKIIIN